MPIPFSEVAAYYDFMRLDEHFQRERWLDIVAVCDTAMIEYGKGMSARKQRTADKKNSRG
jgi:hypothetical protein